MSIKLLLLPLLNLQVVEKPSFAPLLDPKISKIRDVKIGVFADIHLKMDYDPFNHEDNCGLKGYDVVEDEK